MRQTIQIFLGVQAAAFIVAALVHSGVFLSGLQHPGAATPESIIGLVLLAGLVLSLVWPERTRPIGFVVQLFALLGTLVGAFTIAIGIGPRTVPDLVYHAVLLLVLISGLIVTARAPGRKQFEPR